MEMRRFTLADRKSAGTVPSLSLFFSDISLHVNHTCEPLLLVSPTQLFHTRDKLAISQLRCDDTYLPSSKCCETYLKRAWNGAV